MLYVCEGMGKVLFLLCTKCKYTAWVYFKGILDREVGKLQEGRWSSGSHQSGGKRQQQGETRIALC